MRRAFGASLPTDEELATSKEITEFDRTLAFFDGKEIVATAGIFTYEMTVPGGTLPCGGVTRVSVLTTHRRRGLLTAMMRRQRPSDNDIAPPQAGSPLLCTRVHDGRVADFAARDGELEKGALPARALDECNRRLGQRQRQGNPGQPGAGAEVGDLRGSAHRLELQRDERVGEMAIDDHPGLSHGGGGERMLGEQSRERRELARSVARQPETPCERVDPRAWIGHPA